MVLLLESGGDLLEAQSGLLNVFHQDPKGGLRAQRSHGAGPWHQSSLLALLAIELRVGSQVAELTWEPEPIQSAGLVQLAQDRVTGVVQLPGQLGGGQPGGAAPDQLINSEGEAAVLGKANAFVVPQAVAVKVGGVVQGVPLAVVGVTPEIADLLEEAACRDQGVAEGLGDLIEHPALAAVQEFFQAGGG